MQSMHSVCWALSLALYSFCSFDFLSHTRSAQGTIKCRLYGPGCPTWFPALCAISVNFSFYFLGSTFYYDPWLFKLFSQKIQSSINIPIFCRYTNLEKNLLTTDVKTLFTYKWIKFCLWKEAKSAVWITGCTHWWAIQTTKKKQDYIEWPSP